MCVKIAIDTARNELTIEDGGGVRKLPLYSKRAFEILSQLWLKVGWTQKYPYTFAWLGRYRRLSKDYEKCTQNSEGMIYIASIHTMLKRIAAT